MICPLNPEVSNIILGENPFDDEICPWWDLRILDKNDKIIFSSHDWGRGTIMELIQSDLDSLIEKGIDASYLITPAFVPSNVTRIINGAPQSED